MAPNDIPQPDVVKLDGTNYAEWKFFIESLLRTKGLHRYAMGTAPVPGPTATEKERMRYEDKDGMALGILTLYMENKLKETVSNLTTAHEVWQRLVETLDPPTRLRSMSLLMKFWKMEYELGLPMGS